MKSAGLFLTNTLTFFADLVIIGAVLLVSCKYIKEAFTKFVAILNTGSVGNVENVPEPEATNAGKTRSASWPKNGGTKMSNSPLVSYTRISPNKNSPRNHAIDTITIHCVVGQCSVETLGNIFAPYFQTGVFKLWDRLRRQSRNVCGRKGPFLV